MAFAQSALVEPGHRSHAQSPAPGVLDVEALRAWGQIKSDDGSDLVIELIDFYLQATPKKIQEIRKAAAESAWDALTRHAHTLKGSSSTLGLHRLAGVCHLLEAESSSLTARSLGPLLEALEAQFIRAREALTAERKQRLQSRPNRQD